VNEKILFFALLFSVFLLSGCTFPNESEFVPDLIPVNSYSELEACIELEENPADFSDCIVNLIENPSDENLCEMMVEHQSTSVKSYGVPCYKQYAIANEDLALCDNISQGGEYRDKYYGECVREIIIKKGDASLCRNFERVLSKDRCILLVATRSTNKNMDLCDTIVYQPTKDECFMYFFIESGDLDKCSELGTAESAERCHYTLSSVEKYADESIYYPENMGYHPQQLREVKLVEDTWHAQWAIRENDTSYCQYIENQEIKQTCYENVEIVDAFCSSFDEAYLKEWCYVWNSKTGYKAKGIGYGVKSVPCERLSNVTVSSDKCAEEIEKMRWEGNLCTVSLNKITCN